MKARYLAVLLLIPAFLAPANAGEPKLPRDGWASWQVPAVDNAPAWCCWNSWRPGDVAHIPCPLDTMNSRGVGVSVGDRDRDMTTSALKVYARTTAGKIDRLQVLAEKDRQAGAERALRVHVCGATGQIDTVTIDPFEGAAAGLVTGARRARRFRRRRRLPVVHHRYCGF